MANFILRNRYFFWGILLCVSYVAVNTAGRVFTGFDFIFILYAFALRDINGDNALGFSLLFGIFYDLNYQIYLGTGILLFMIMNAVKVQVYMSIDMAKFFFRILFIISMATFYTLVSLKLFGYSGYAFWAKLGYYILMDIIAIIVINIVLGGRRVISHS